MINFYVNVYDKLYWRFLREDRHFNYYNLRLVQYYNFLYPTLSKYLYNYTRIFYNSFFNKFLFFKTYNSYKNVHLTEFLVKFYFNFENTYFFNFFENYGIIFNSKNEFIQVPYFFIKNNYLLPQSTPIEFIMFKKNFFKNDLYAFFFHKSSFFFSLKKNFNLVNYQGFEKHEFLQYKCNLAYSLTDSKKVLTSINYVNYKKYFYFFYKLSIILIY